jgi:hypothetical protein
MPRIWWRGLFYQKYEATSGVDRPSVPGGGVLKSLGWGGRIRTFTIRINSAVSYRLDHAPVNAHSNKPQRLPANNALCDRRLSRRQTPSRLTSKGSSAKNTASGGLYEAKPPPAFLRRGPMGSARQADLCLPLPNAMASPALSNQLIFGDLSHDIVHASAPLLRRLKERFVDFAEAAYIGMLMVDAVVFDPTNGVTPPIISAEIQ